MGLFVTATNEFSDQQFEVHVNNRERNQAIVLSTNCAVFVKDNKFVTENFRFCYTDKENNFMVIDLEPNAAVANNMAPALTEPLSPTEKLSGSAATTAPTTRSSSKKSETLNSNSSTTVSSGSGNTSKERKSRHPTNASSTSSTRVTRSKEGYQRAFEQALTSPVASSTTTTTTVNANQKTSNTKRTTNNEQMGLTGVLNNNNNNNNNNSNNNNNNSKHNKSNEASSPEKPERIVDNSTEQLLADLTNHFEEAISVEKSLRKEFEDVLLNKGPADSHVASEAKDILVIKGGSGIGIDPTVSNLISKIQMEVTDKAALTPSSSQIQTKQEEQHLSQKSSQTKKLALSDGVNVSAERSEASVKQISALAVCELPPISTDSTMTASEVEDNLEERLSQLDGTAIVSTSTDVVGEIIPATPPRTPIQYQQHQQQVLLLQQQLQQTPPTPGSQQLQQQNALTPQSATSVNTLGSSNLAQSYIKDASVSTGGSGAGGELEDTDLEEVLKALKGFDGNSAGDALPDLNVLFNEVYTTLNNYEEISSQPASTSAFKPNPLKDLQSEIEKVQLNIQRKIDFLLRRIRKLQARNMCKHVSEEVAGVFELAARTFGKGSGTTLTASAPAECRLNIRGATRSSLVQWSEELRNPVSAVQVSSMLRKLEAIANAQQLCTSSMSAASSSSHSLGMSSSNSHGQLRKSNKKSQDPTAGLPVSSPSAMQENSGMSVIPTFDEFVTDELSYVVGLLQTELREVQTAVDSDATESSSGGESADEMVTYNNQVQQSLSIVKRAAWRYSRDRAAIASRWSWLLSQVADLEIKIRQHNELYQEIVRTKGAVVTSDGTDHAASSSVNGYKGDGSMNMNKDHKFDAEGEERQGSCRTRGYIPSHFRKRKLLQTANIHTISKKAARPSTIKCGCQWPLHPCALCTGRSDPTAPRDLPDTMMLADRIALLDEGYHPVLSFPDEISNSLHFEAITRLPDWQLRVMRCQVKSIAKGIWKAEREAAAASGHQLLTKRRYIKKKDRMNEKLSSPDTAATSTGASASNSEMAGSGTSAGMGGGSAGNGASGNGGNGTGNSSSTSTTPLVANKAAKYTKRSHNLVANKPQLETMSPIAATTNNYINPSPNSISNASNSNNTNNSYIHQTSDYPHPTQNSDAFSHNLIHSSSIYNNNNNSNSSNNSKSNKHQRKLSSTSTTTFNYHNNNNSSNPNHVHNNSSYYGNNGSNDFSFLCTQDNWDMLATRSRTSSPTHGSGNSFYKHERSLDRKNRSSYDIDNIVIPYSVAASTRVEILPYKEIPTPKWRVIKDQSKSALNKDDPQSTTENVDGEDSSENAVITNGVLDGTVDSREDIAEENKVVNHDQETIEEVVPPAIQNEGEEKENESSKTTAAKSETPSGGNDSKSDGSGAVERKEDDSVDEVTEPVSKKAKIEPKQNVEQCEKALNSLETEMPSGSIALDNGDADVEREVDDDVFDDTDPVDALIEDISDEAMMSRHERALTEERRKFQTFLKFPWSTRSRANRRIDSRAESSGANTPDPTSPAPNTPSVGGGDQESIPSPLAASAILNPMDSVPEGGECSGNGMNSSNAVITPLPPAAISSSFNSKRYERRRTTSAKKELERRSSTPDPKEFVPPYEPLKFPLHDEVFENMVHTSTANENSEHAKFHNEDFSSLGAKYPRSSRISFRNEFSSGSGSGSAKRSSKSTSASNNFRLVSQRSKVGGAGGGGGKERSYKTVCENGKIEEDDDFGEPILDDDELMHEDDDEDYPRHHLVPPPESDSKLDEYDNDGYEAYVGERRSTLNDSDGDSSDMEPFQDDDPNDPEWRGGGNDRFERIRRKP